MDQVSTEVPNRKVWNMFLSSTLQDNGLSQSAASVIGIYGLEFVRDVRNVDPMRRTGGLSGGRLSGR
jgi:hypothetical protein